MSDLVPKARYLAKAIPFDTEEGPVPVIFGYTKEDVRQVVANLEIIEGEYTGRRLTWFGFFKSAKSAEIAVKALRVMGFKGDDLDTVFDQPLDNVVSIVVEHDEYDGKTRAKVAWINDPNGGQGFKMAKPMSKDDMRKFSAQMKKVVKEIPNVDGEKAEPNGKTHATPGDSHPLGNDGLPF